MVAGMGEAWVLEEKRRKRKRYECTSESSVRAEGLEMRQTGTWKEGSI